MGTLRPSDRGEILGIKDNYVDVHALEFTKARIQDYYEYHIETMEKEHEALKTERNREIRKITETVDLLRARRDKISKDLKEDLLELTSMIRSGCEIYLKDLQILRKRTKMTEFEDEISRVTKVLESDVVNQAKGGLYDKYYSGEYCDYCGRLIPVKGKTCNKCVRVLERRNPLRSIRP
jgi:hypothetical protein